MRDRPGPRLLAALGAAVAATSLAAALLLVIRRMQVSFDTSGLASILAMIAGVTLVTLVDAASIGAGTAAKTLQRLAVRLGLALTLAATLPGKVFPLKVRTGSPAHKASLVVVCAL